jgi:hypothetical protein
MMRTAFVALGALLIASPVSAQQTPSATLRIRVVDAATREPVESELDFPALDVSFHVPATGVFMVRDVRPGTHILRVRKVGYAGMTRIAVATRDTVSIDFALTRAVPTLDTVVTHANMLERREFLEHQRLGLGQFFDSDEIRTANAPRISSFLERARGVKVRHGSNLFPDRITTTRSIGRCTTMNTFLNETLISGSPDPRSAPRAVSRTSESNNAAPGGQPTSGVPNSGTMRSPTATAAQAFDLNEIPIGLITGIEVYVDVGAIPPAFRTSRDECGVLVLWTR